MASTDAPNAPVTPQEVPRKLSQRDRETAILFFLTPRVESAGGKLKGSIVSEAALNFRCGTATVKRCWKKYGAHCLSPSVDNPIVVGRKKGSGRPRKWTPEDIQAAMKDVPFSQRRTLCALAEAINVPQTSLYRMLRVGDIKRHSSAIRPILLRRPIVQIVQFSSRRCARRRKVVLHV